jgi:hypothetical protein
MAAGTLMTLSVQVQYSVIRDLVGLPLIHTADFSIVHNYA